MRTRRGRERVRFEHEFELADGELWTVDVIAEVEFGYPPPRCSNPDDPKFSDPGAGDEIIRMTIRDADSGLEITDEDDCLTESGLDEITEAAFDHARTKDEVNLF